MEHRESGCTKGFVLVISLTWFQLQQALLTRGVPRQLYCVHGSGRGVESCWRVSRQRKPQITGHFTNFTTQMLYNHKPNSTLNTTSTNKQEFSTHLAKL